MNIYEKILDIMKNVQYINKDDRIEYGKTSYKALSEEKVTTIFREQFINHNLIVFPIEFINAPSRINGITHVDVKYRIVNVEDPSEFVDVVSSGDGYDSQDKGTGKALTYAFKYMFLRTFAIPTGDDPDKIASDAIDSEFISDEVAAGILRQCKKDGVDCAKLCAMVGISDLCHMTKDTYKHITAKWSIEVIPQCKAS